MAKKSTLRSFDAAIVLRTPDVIFTPIRDMKGRPTAIAFNFDPRPSSGILGGLIDLSDPDDPLGVVDFGHCTEKDVRTQLQNVLDQMRAGTFGKQDIRDLISGRGDPAGLVPWIGPALGVAWKFIKSPVGEKAMSRGVAVLLAAGAWVAAVASNVVGDYITDKRHEGEQKKADEDKKGEEKKDQKTDPDAGADDTDDDTPKDDKKKKPQPEETGGRLTPQQILRVTVRLKAFTPPARDDREPRQGKLAAPIKPIVPFNPAINWGDDGGSKKNPHITTEIIPNDGYTDPVRG